MSPQDHAEPSILDETISVADLVLALDSRPGAPDVYRPEQLLQLGIIGRQKLYELLRSGELPARRISRKSIVILREEWLTWLRQCPRVTDRRAAAEKARLAKWQCAQQRGEAPTASRKRKATRDEAARP